MCIFVGEWEVEGGQDRTHQAFYILAGIMEKHLRYQTCEMRLA